MSTSGVSQAVHEDALNEVSEPYFSLIISVFLASSSKGRTRKGQEGERYDDC